MSAADQDLRAIVPLANSASYDTPAMADPLHR
ncbi:hypothetical protein SHXM_01091 [Streptomyces hygroscopicus]|nr:hypothetical protein SHXM_01091 [Streptomyces hygroscopicus]